MTRCPPRHLKRAAAPGPVHVVSTKLDEVSLGKAFAEIERQNVRAEAVILHPDLQEVLCRIKGVKVENHFGPILNGVTATIVDLPPPDPVKDEVPWIERFRKKHRGRKHDYCVWGTPIFFSTKVRPDLVAVIGPQCKATLRIQPAWVMNPST